jgi:colicin import membrane protein
MESCSLFPRKSSKEEILLGVGGSIFVHFVIFALALFASWNMPREAFKPPFATVNLVSMQDIGADAAVPKKGTPTAKSTDGGSLQASPKPSASARDRSAPVVPVKRLQMDERVTRQEKELKKLDAPAAPKIPEEPKNIASVEKSLEKLIQKPKAPPKPAPIIQESGQESAKSSTSTTTQSASKSTQTSSGSDPKGNKDASQEGGAKGKGAGEQKGIPEGSEKGTAQSGVGGSPDGAQISAARMSYYKTIQSAIRRHYVLPPSLKANELQATLILVVRRDGKIMDVRIDKQSGNPLFDDSVMRAVRRADPLPPFPEVYNPPQEELALRFRPEDFS